MTLLSNFILSIIARIQPVCSHHFQVCTVFLLGHSVRSNSLQPPWTIAHQASLSMAFPKQEYWDPLPFPSPGDLPNPGLQPTFPMTPKLSANSIPTEPLWKSRCNSGKEPTWQSRTLKRHGLNPWKQTSPGGGHSNLLQYSCLENPMNRAWWAIVHRVTKRWTRVSDQACRFVLGLANMEIRVQDRTVPKA